MHDLRDRIVSEEYTSEALRLSDVAAFRQARGSAFSAPRTYPLLNRESRTMIVDAASISNKTKENVNKLQRYRAAIHDTLRVQRRAKQECRCCYYVAQSVGGCALTKTVCPGCRQHFFSASTCRDVLCHECAKARGLCKRCGGDLEDTDRASGKSVEAISDPDFSVAG